MIYLAAFFIASFLPLLTSQFRFYPASWGKALVFRIVVLLLIYLFSCLLILRKIKINKKIKEVRVLWLFALLSILAVISTIFSQNPYFSFWGDPQRGGGSFNLILFLIFTALAFLLIKKEQWRKLWDFNFIIAGVVTLIALLQKITLLPIYYDNRPYSTMGGAPILALYLALLIPIALSFAMNADKKRKWLYFSSALLFFIGVLITETRSSMLALFAGFLFLLIFYKRKKLLWLKLTAVLLIAVSLAGVLFLRSANIDDRVSVWKISLNALKEKPLLGFGPENFSIAFEKHYDNSLPGLKTYNNWFDRAHNIILDISVTYGILFLIIYFSIFIILFLKVPSFAVKTAFIIYFVNNLFSFDAFSTYFMIFLITAYAMHLCYKDSFVSVLNKKEQNPLKYVVLIAAALVLFPFVWISSLKPLFINGEINEAEYTLDINKFDDLLTKHSLIDHYVRINYATTASRIISSSSSLDTSLSLMEKSISVLEQASELRPKYARTWYMLSLFANTLLKYDDSEELKQKALLYCQRAKELSPSHPLIAQQCP